MEETGYLMVWLAYTGAALLLCFTGWLLFRRLPVTVSTPLMTVLAVLVLMPWNVAAGSDSLAPAWIVMLFDGLLAQDEARPGRAGIPLALAATLALIIGLAAGFRLNRRGGTSHDRTVEDSH